MKIKPLAVISLLLISPLPIASAADVVSLWGGARGTIILKSDGTVWTWGAGSFGKLGINTTTGRSLVPVEVHGATNIDYLHSVTAIMAGETHNMALQSDKTLWSWGYNFVGELASRDPGQPFVPYPGPRYPFIPHHQAV
jgi:alpha-tubulin suppressor-like RCC1 family protein